MAITNLSQCLRMTTCCISLFSFFYMFPISWWTLTSPIGLCWHKYLCYVFLIGLRQSVSEALLTRYILIQVLLFMKTVVLGWDGLSCWGNESEDVRFFGLFVLSGCFCLFLETFSIFSLVACMPFVGLEGSGSSLLLYLGFVLIYGLYP